MAHPLWGRMPCCVLLSILACTTSSHEGGLAPHDPELVSLAVSPATASVETGKSLSFQVEGTLSDGSTEVPAVTWTATGGSISTGGVFQAGSATGQYLVIARGPGGHPVDTAHVTVQDSLGVSLTGITVAPSSATLASGQSQGFSATGHYSNGSSGALAVTWIATGGVMSAGGTYTAGATAGSFLVIGQAGGLADTAAITVTDTTSPPPPPPPGGTVLLDEHFDDAQVAGRGWYDNTSPVISTAEHHGGTGSVEMAFGVGARTAVKGAAIRHLVTPTDRVYLSYWVKYSASWTGSGKTYHPHEFHFTTTEDGDFVGPSATHLTAYIEQNYQQGGVPRLAITDALNIDTTQLNVDLTGVTEQRSVAGCNGSSDGYSSSCYASGSSWRNEKIWKAGQPYFLPTPGAGYKNDWHRVEAYFQLNSIQGGTGVADGIAQYWFDGQLVLDKQDVLFRTGAHPTMQWKQLIFAPYIGDGSPVAQAMWVDDLIVATARVP